MLLAPVWTLFEDTLFSRPSPERVVALGRKAERALDSVGVDSTYVRHPSQGSAKKFARGVQAVVQSLSGA